VRYNRKYILKQLIAIVILVQLISGCKTTRYVPEYKYLLSDIDIKVDNDQIDKEELSTYIRQKDNLRILRILKFHLWLYSLSNKKKQNGLLKRIGEPPVIYDLGLKDKSVQQIEQYLYNKGYYQANVTDTVFFNKKKAKVVYKVESGNPYLVRNITYQIKDDGISDIILENKNESLLKTGDIFDVDVLEKERSRITKILKNDGYFLFADEFIHFKVDTAIAHRKANIEMIIEKPKSSTLEGIGEQKHKQYTIADYSIFIDKQKVQNELGSTLIYSDTTKRDGFTFYHNGKMSLNENLFYKSVEIKPGEKYTKLEEDKTYNNLYALRQFKFVNIQYHEDPEQGDSLNGILKGKIFLPIQTKQNYSFDVEGTTSGNIGIAGNINYQHRNLFGGAEIFNITIKGANEWQTSLFENGYSDYNTHELGGQIKLTVPGFLFPINEEKLNLFSMPFTSFSIAYNYQDRPNYTRTILNATIGYNWKSGSKYSHTFNLIDLNGVKVPVLDDNFINEIEDLYIKSSYEDHIISSSNYSLVYSNQGKVKRPDYHFFRFNIEAAGNMLNALAVLAGNQKSYEENLINQDQIVYYKFFDTRFAQYLKSDFDFRFGYKFDKYNSIATRAFFGVAFPYGNFNVTPFEKRYFTGGANGIRAWHVRSLGPGTYTPEVNEYPNQSADIKLEANVEYRFKLFWIMEGALFVDAGNIWAINKYDNREGAVFKFPSFYKQFAVGTGLGLRVVSPYFILRTDLGLKLRDPSVPVGERWIPLSRSFNGNDLNFNIAIGYPF
jgi:outer membrane protein assembly factor BamA